MPLFFCEGGRERFCTLLGVCPLYSSVLFSIFIYACPIIHKKNNKQKKTPFHSQKHPLHCITPAWYPHYTPYSRLVVFTAFSFCFFLLPPELPTPSDCIFPDSLLLQTIALFSPFLISSLFFLLLSRFLTSHIIHPPPPPRTEHVVLRNLLSSYTPLFPLSHLALVVLLCDSRHTGMSPKKVTFLLHFSSKVFLFLWRKDEGEDCILLQKAITKKTEARKKKQTQTREPLQLVFVVLFSNQVGR